MISLICYKSLALVLPSAVFTVALQNALMMLRRSSAVGCMHSISCILCGDIVLVTVTVFILRNQRKSRWTKMIRIHSVTESLEMNLFQRFRVLFIFALTDIPVVGLISCRKYNWVNALHAYTVWWVLASMVVLVWIVVSAHLWKIYVIPRVIYGLEVLSCTLSDVQSRERLQRDMLRRIQSLPRSTAIVAVNCLLGIRPIEQELDLRRLTCCVVYCTLMVL